MLLKTGRVCHGMYGGQIIPIPPVFGKARYKKNEASAVCISFCHNKNDHEMKREATIRRANRRAPQTSGGDIATCAQCMLLCTCRFQLFEVCPSRNCFGCVFRCIITNVRWVDTLAIYIMFKVFRQRVASLFAKPPYMIHVSIEPLITRNRRVGNKAFTINLRYQCCVITKNKEK